MLLVKVVLLIWYPVLYAKISAILDTAARNSITQWTLVITRKCPLRRHILAPPEGLRAPEVPGVNPGGRPQESGGDSKAI